jgi:DNA polymerase elongation subunit (family B)
MKTLIIDIETAPITKERLDSYISAFEPELMVEGDPDWVEVEADEKPKKGAKKKPKKPKPKVGSKSAKGGLHWLTGQICCVGVLPTDGEPVMFADEDEEVVLVGLYHYLYDAFPYLTVTFNGAEFDLPFIRMRGLLYGLDFSGLLPLEKFSKTHIDIYQVLGGKWVLPAKLAEYCWYFGIEDIDDTGAHVAELFRAGDIEAIVRHCRGDVIATEKLYKKVFPGGKRTKKY